ncbi:MAG TPA: sialidase family protein [Candidatus Cybelea sp.]|nr:sialidase family protein [Candidatus Cybelea sp.]
MRSFRLLFALLISAVAISCAGGGRNFGTLPATQYGTEILAGPTRFEGEQLWGPADANHWEPVTAADPSSNWVYQMTTDQRPDFLLFRASNDRGRTWHEPRHICRRGVRVPFQYDPQIVVATTGQIDVVCLDGFKPGVVFSSSRDHGDSWTESVRLDGSLRYSDKPTLVISPDGKDVYVAYNVDYALYVTSSHDYGESWNAPVKGTTTHYWYYPYSGTVAPNGTMWFAVDGEAGTNQTGDGHVGLVTSSDGGATWREIPFAITHEGAPCTVKHCYPDFFTGEEAVAADRLGHLVFVFAKNDRTQGPNSLYASRSSDGGATWSQPSLINRAGNNTSPAMMAGPRAGDFRLVWQDNRNGPNAWNTWFARSEDGGATWTSAIRLSNVGNGARYKHRAGYDFPFGDYLGISVDAEGVNHVIWGEGSAVYHPGGTWWSRGPI